MASQEACILVYSNWKPLAVSEQGSDVFLHAILRVPRTCQKVVKWQERVS